MMAGAASVIRAISIDISEQTAEMAHQRKLIMQARRGLEN